MTEEKKEDMLLCDENGENCITWEEWMAEMKTNDEKKNLRNWINNHFPPFGSYNAFYNLTHPWKMVEHIGYVIKYAWQRVFRGWDDTAVWDVNSYLNKLIPQLIKRLKEVGHGYPMEMYEGMTPIDEGGWEYSKEDDKLAVQKWDDILQDIIDGFEAAKEIDEKNLWNKDPEYTELNDKFEKGFNLFRKYYFNLWD